MRKRGRESDERRGGGEMERDGVGEREMLAREGLFALPHQVSWESKREGRKVDCDRD